jgi:N-acetylglucosamine kinase-like BadF-type ATPase
VLSAIGYVYGKGSVVANGSGAHIYQPLALYRSGNWGWTIGPTGAAIKNGSGMITSPADGYDRINPAESGLSGGTLHLSLYLPFPRTDAGKRRADLR